MLIQERVIFHNCACQELRTPTSWSPSYYHMVHVHCGVLWIMIKLTKSHVSPCFLSLEFGHSGAHHLSTWCILWATFKVTTDLRVWEQVPGNVLYCIANFAVIYELGPHPDWAYILGPLYSNMLEVTPIAVLDIIDKLLDDIIIKQKKSEKPNRGSLTSDSTRKV